MFAFPYINELKLLLGALVIEPASGEEEHFVGIVLLQLERNLKESKLLPEATVDFFLCSTYDLGHFTLLARLVKGGTEKVGQSPVLI